MSGFRLKYGGTALDRSQTLSFSFDRRRMTGHRGDTLASALLANGVRLVGRSFKYHRPRGIWGSGVEEPNALVRLRSGARSEPNMRATTIELYDGLVAESQNRWPSLSFDAMAVNGLLSPMLAAGFYYKTFIGPTRRAWMFYEHYIRRAAGLGTASLERDPDIYEKLHAFCDVLVVGGGPAGLMAATVAADAGARVILADEQPGFGGQLSSERAEIDGQPSADWAAARTVELARHPDCMLLPRTTVFGYYDDEVLGAVERVADHLPEPPEGQPRQRHWTIHARAVVLATGAIERPLILDGNDKPGVMLASAAVEFAARYGVSVGRNVLVFANNDSGLQAAAELVEAGVSLCAVVDSRPARALPEALRQRGVECFFGHAVVGARGRPVLDSVDIAPISPDGKSVTGPVRRLGIDVLAVSGGWTPTVHLATQAGGPPAFAPEIQAFVPGVAHRNWHAAGAVTGVFALDGCLAGGVEAARKALESIGLAAPKVVAPASKAAPLAPDWIAPLWEVPTNAKKARKFVDLQHDVTVTDILLADREGFSSVEHLKRYTTLGMATDQGKTSNISGLAVLAAARGVAIPEVGTTRFRPPYTPVTIGALAGREVGPHYKPVRRTPMHDWHIEAGAEMMPAGEWLRPRIYPQAGETIEQAYVREARAVRTGVGMVDVSTLGKIEVKGPDAAAFLDLLYANSISTLPLRKARYGAMLREDGFVFDDGTVWRLGETRFLLTTTTVNAAAVMSHMERHLATAWPNLRVHTTSVTEQWAGIAIAGPRSRTVLERAVQGVDLGSAAFPFMAIRHGAVDGVPVMICRLSFSGELAYEVCAPADYGLAVWERLFAAGKEDGIVPYGLEALGTLRIEKGHVAGAELNGQTTLDDLGLGRMASPKKHFIGQRMLAREALVRPDRVQLVGVLSLSGEPLRGGAHLVAGSTKEQPGQSQGHVTSTTYSPALEKYMALALLSRGRTRHGEKLWAADPLRGTHLPVEVVAPCVYDPDGTRLHG